MTGFAQPSKSALATLQYRYKSNQMNETFQRDHFEFNFSSKI